MQAIRFEQFGEPAEVLRLSDVPLPEPQTGEVRVRMLASPVNPSDLITIRGIYGKLPRLPATPGFEGVGIVEASGGGLLGKLSVGKRVAVLNGKTGNWCEQTVIPARQAIPLAKDLTLEQAATFFVNPATAYIMTRKILRIPKGEWLLQTASGSALGGMVIRLAQRFGFRTINIVRRNEQIEEIKEIGGHAVIHFDPSEHDSRYLREAIQSETGQPGVRFAIDPVSGATGSAVIDCLGEKGRLLVFGTLADEPLSFSSRTLMTVEARIEGFWLARWMAEQSILSKLKLVKSITRLMREGVLVSEVGSTFPLTEISEAVRTAETVGRGGKVLLEISRT